MPSELGYVFLVSWLFVTAIFLYSAYWSFVIRRALVTSLYRKRSGSEEWDYTSSRSLSFSPSL